MASPPFCEQWRSEMIFVSLGMVLLDELRYPGKAPLMDVMGGSGAYATLGARLFAMNSQSSTIGFFVLAGKDFPEVVENWLQEWKITLILKRNPDKLSKRGLLEYEDTTFGPKTFRYTTEPLKPSPISLVSSPLLGSQVFHLLSTQEDIVKQVTELLNLRKQRGMNKKPLIMWEPFPAACRPENLESILNACKIVDVFSPNHLEISSLFTDKVPKDLQPEVLERYAQKFLDHSIGLNGKGCIVIRAAEYGSLTASRATGFIWSPAFYTSGSEISRVIDPTGAGNAFIGGFAMALQQKLTLEEAAAYGNVAASFAIEQIGAPRLEFDSVIETWNGIVVKNRLAEYRARLQNLVL